MVIDARSVDPNREIWRVITCVRGRSFLIIYSYRIHLLYFLKNDEKYCVESTKKKKKEFFKRTIKKQFKKGCIISTNLRLFILFNFFFLFCYLFSASPSDNQRFGPCCLMWPFQVVLTSSISFCLGCVRPTDQLNYCGFIDNLGHRFLCWFSKNSLF